MTEKLAINVVFLLHFILFSAKLFAGFITGSAAVISDGVQSGIDILTTIVVGMATKVNKLPADSDHQFGHTRAEPLAAFFVSIMTAVAGLEIIRYGIEKIIKPSEISNVSNLVIVMSVMIAFSGIISYIMTKIGNLNHNKAMMAMGKETFGDMIISFGAICGILGSYYGYLWLDPLMAIIIGFYVIHIAYDIVKDNIDLLMGAKADKEQIGIIQDVIFSKFPIVTAIHDLNTQKLGTKIYATIHCEIQDQDYSFKKIHDIEESIQSELLLLGFIENTTIHLDFKDDSRNDRVLRAS